jgi:transposase
VLHGDKGYDTNPVRQRVEAHGTLPNIPPKANRVWKSCFSPMLYPARNAIERMFCRLKDFRRVAIRLATNFLAAVCLAATVGYWLWSRSRLRALCYIRAEHDPPERVGLRSG